MSDFAIAVEIASERHMGNLSAEQVEFCIGELCKAIDAPPLGDEADAYGDYTTDGMHGYLFYSTDGHNFHSITLRASACADIITIVQILCDMCTKGCVVTCNDGDDRDKNDYLWNFAYRLNQI